MRAGMEIRNLFKTLLFFGVFLLFGCSINSNGDIIIDPPHCSIVSSENKNEFLSPTINFTVLNDGEGSTAHDVSLSIKLKRGGFIVDDATVFFGNLEKGESKTEEANFFKLKNHSEYSSKDVKLVWGDEIGGYYE
jgi:hypothetical protein